MSNRQLIRPNLGDIRQEPETSPRRKAVPPDATSAEAYYYVKQMGAATPIVVVLNDGERLEGIRWLRKLLRQLPAPKSAPPKNPEAILSSGHKTHGATARRISS